MTTARKRIEIGGRPAVLAELHYAGFELPPKVVGAAVRASELAVAAREATVAVTDIELAIAQHGRREIVVELVANGPSTAPGADLRAAETRLVDLRDMRDLYLAASRQATAAVEYAVVAHAGSIGERLVDALERLLADARPDANAVRGLRFADPDAVHELPPPAAHAFHRLTLLAVRHDLIRRSAVGLFAELSVARNEPARRRAAEDFPIDRFLGAGVVGPVGRGTGDPLYSRTWHWSPGSMHRVAALVEACDAEDRRLAAEAKLQPEALATPA